MARASYMKLAGDAFRERQQAAGKLGKAVTQHMQELGMPGGKFEIVLQPLPGTNSRRTDWSASSFWSAPIPASR